MLFVLFGLQVRPRMRHQGIFRQLSLQRSFNCWKNHFMFFVLFCFEEEYFDGLVIDSNISLANALEIVQFCTRSPLCICIWSLLATLKEHRKLKSVPMDDIDLALIHSLCGGFWWAGDARIQGIRSHATAPILSTYAGLGTSWTNVLSLLLASWRSSYISIPPWPKIKDRVNF